MSTAQKSEALDLAANHAQEDAPVGFAWSGWACMYPGKLPRLYGALEIASVNLDAANGDQLIHLSTSPDPKAQSRLAAYDHDARQREMQLLSEIEALERVALNALKQLEESTHTTKKGMGGNWLTVVYRDIQPGDEARAIADHPKASALSWSHALHDRDAAIAAQAKNGGAA